METLFFASIGAFLYLLFSSEGSEFLEMLGIMVSFVAAVLVTIAIFGALGLGAFYLLMTYGAS